jgi:inner membrane transporter RhtA
LAAAGIVLIAPWTNNGINVLGVLFAYYGVLGFYIVLREGSKIMKGGGCCKRNALASLLIVPLVMETDSVTHANISFFRVALAFVHAIPYIRNESTRPASSPYI